MRKPRYPRPSTRLSPDFTGRCAIAPPIPYPWQKATRPAPGTAPPRAFFCGRWSGGNPTGSPHAGEPGRTARPGAGPAGPTLAGGPPCPARLPLPVRRCRPPGRRAALTAWRSSSPTRTTARSHRSGPCGPPLATPRPAASAAMRPASPTRKSGAGEAPRRASSPPRRCWCGDPEKGLRAGNRRASDQLRTHRINQRGEREKAWVSLP